MTEDKIICVALFINNDGESSSIRQSKCTSQDLHVLRTSDAFNEIILLGWLPIEYYKENMEIIQTMPNFVNYN